MKAIVGGGPKKVLYTLKTVKRIGLKNSAKALKSKNACKACGLGMGGQQGGMTNELGEFPSVCNKSIQAQSTDIQPPIPDEIFEHSLDELKELSAHEIEHLGRLGHPIYKNKNSNHYKIVDWEWALDYTASKFKQADPNNTFFYSSGRSSNESGFVLQLLARLYGTNNVNNCSYYCHQATSVGLGTTIGTGTATVELDDVSHSDCIFVIGANPSSNHPRFIHKLKNCRDRGGDVIIINPAKEPGLVKFAVPKSAPSMIMGGTEIASLYLQPNIGGDLALFKGIAKCLIDSDNIDAQFIEKHCNHFKEFKTDINGTSWNIIEKHSGISQQMIEKVAQMYIKAKHVVFSWGMGITHHQHGCDNVEYIANLALLRGMIGKKNAGLLPLRGHSNVQGIGTIGVKPVLPKDVFSALEKQLNIKLPQTKGLDTYNALKKAYDKEIECACIVGGNLYSATPDSNWAKNALEKIPFKLFLTTTLNEGHLNGVDNSEALILPVAARDEEQQSTTQESMFNYIRLSDGGIERLDNVKSEVDILASLGEQLVNSSNFDFKKFKAHRSIRQTISKTIPGMEDIEHIDKAKKEFHIRGRIIHTAKFNTESGKASFVVRSLPTTSSSNSKGDYPFLLASVRSEGQFNSIIYEESDSYRYGATRNTILMNQEDMKKLDIENEESIVVESTSGTMHKVIAQSFDIPTGNVLAYYPEANVLTERKLDKRSLTPNFKSVAVRITKLSTQNIDT